MRSRRHTAAQAEAVSRRLELLSAELAATRGMPEETYDEPDTVVPPGRVTYPATHTRVPMDWLAAAEDHTHVPGLREPEPAYDDEPPTRIPVPGRHAARRAAAFPLPQVVPPTLRGRVRLGPGQLAVVAVLVALGLAVTAWWVIRGQQPGESVTAAPAAPLTGVPDGSPSGGPMTGAAAGSTPSGEVVVDVAGKVRRPGIVVLDSGSRVDDAIHAAGGVRRGVDLSSLNLARVLVDGEQILVGMPAPTGAPGAAVPSAGAPDPTGLVNLNTATLAQLDELPGVGPVTGQAIIDWRTANGGFSSVDELLEVDGIGDATLADLAPHVTI
ncbi:helix-hairpin-helix domain-containing protein [Nocardioides speluncae]|uniref:helix-hairpin-helix domain-containing protein n=1 Tax=Nocardioides speluncae TaxID=2670337 RepID=UPI000D69CCE8|nr:helix-hairpin-helix domain-containing protein [Nocardioides speluncae]